MSQEKPSIEQVINYHVNMSRIGRSIDMNTRVYSEMQEELLSIIDMIEQGE